MNYNQLPYKQRQFRILDEEKAAVLFKQNLQTAAFLLFGISAIITIFAFSF